MTLKEYLTTRTETGYFAEVYDKTGDLPWAIVFIDSSNVFIERMNQQLLDMTVTHAELAKDISYTGEIYRIEVDYIEHDDNRMRKEVRENMELKDTVEGMVSPDYKERFKAEYHQTKIRYEKLKRFCNRIEAAELMQGEAPKHDCPLTLLRDQQRHMGEYLHVLEIRAEIEHIEL